MTIRHQLLFLAVALSIPTILPAAEPAISAVQRRRIERGLKELDGRLAKLRTRPPAMTADHLADAAIYAKGVAWALRYRESLTTADVTLLTRALELGPFSAPSWLMVP